MSNNFGTWSPLTSILPNVEEDLDYKFFYVTESGSVPGLDIEFKVGDWLVYIKENNQKNWYKTSGGAIMVDVSNNGHMIDPGFYTKIQLDNSGHIVDAGYIKADDLPKHTHSIDSITGDWESKIRDYVKRLFNFGEVNNLNTVSFKYDEETQTISANVNIDEDTIIRNEWGEISLGNGTAGQSPNNGSSQGFTGKIKIEQVTNLSNRLANIENNLKDNSIICRSNSALEEKPIEGGGGKYLSVKFDNHSLVLNSDGELSVSPNVIAGGPTDGSNTPCGGHTHDVSQIADLEKKVVELINQNQAVDVAQIPIDGETIIINSSGELASVGSGTKAHTHKMKDIVDLKPEIADTWASNQPLQSNENYTSGKFDLTGQTIGHSVKKINDYLNDADDRLSTLEKKVSITDAPEPDGIQFAEFKSTYINETIVKDKNTQKKVTAGTQIKLESNYFYPANKGTLNVYIDGETVSSINLEHAFNDSNFNLLDVRDSYYNIAMYRGHYESMKFSYTTSNLNEGYHNIYFEHVVNNESKRTQPINFQIYVPTQPTIENEFMSLPKNNVYVSGIPGYNGDGKVEFNTTIGNVYSKCFVNDVIYQYSTDNGKNWITPLILSWDDDNVIHFEPTTLYIEKGNESPININQRFYNVTGNAFTNVLNVPSVSWNCTDIEEYRVTYGKDYDPQQTPTVIGSQLLEDYDPKEPVPNYEMIIKNNIGIRPLQDFSWIGGPDYTNNGFDKDGFIWCNFKFEAPFVNNLHINVVQSGNRPFSMNRNGTLSGVEIYVAQGNTSVPGDWVNGNAPYIGYGGTSGLDNNGLDLFRSDNITRYITFGQHPDIQSGYLYVKVGIQVNLDGNADIDLGALVSSVKESIDEWS